MLQVGERVPGPLKKEHRHVDLEQVLGSFARRLAGRVERKAEERQPPHTRQVRCGLGLRSHAPAERLAAGNEGKVWSETTGFSDRRTNRRMGKFGRIRPPRSLLHERELI